MVAPVFMARGLTKVYVLGEVNVQALRGVDFDLFPGELVVLLGPSGSGKSTLLNILGGLDVPTAGSVVYQDHNLTTAGEQALTEYRRSHVGFVFQFYNLIPVLTAAENVELPLLLSTLTRQERATHVRAALGLVGLKDRIDHYPRQLSGGQEQRVGIARAIVSDPTILLADEPTGNLDRSAAEAVMALLTKLHRELNKTILMVTHDPRAADYAQETLHFDKGTVASS